LEGFLWRNDLSSGFAFTTVVIIATAVYFVEAYRKRQALFTYLSTAGVYMIHFLLIQMIFPESWYRIWPPITAAFTAIMAVVYWQLYTRKLGEEFQTPYRIAGLGLMMIPIVAAFAKFDFDSYDSFKSVIVFAIATVVYLVEAGVKKSLGFRYLGIGFVIGTIWSVLATLGVEEMQAYIFPLGIALVGSGWYQRTRVNDQFYQPVTIIGLGVFFVSAFIQSVGEGFSIWPDWVYAILLTIECMVAIGWGIRQKSRGYVQFGAIALITTAIVQLGPSFAALDRWIQMGSIGFLLLVMGLVALFRREEVLETRQKITQEWRSWNT
jgi:hypothetical protein